MSRWLVAIVLCFGVTGLAGAQQTGSDVKSGLNADSGSMTGANIDAVNGTNANGTPMQQSPGSSMTNGAGNNAMSPNAAGGSGATETPAVPPLKITHGTVAPLTSGTGQ